jgi:uncharacterized membrane protein YeaQ/YmgE (transglycosylase-associated protein family)
LSAIAGSRPTNPQGICSGFSETLNDYFVSFVSFVVKCLAFGRVVPIPSDLQLEGGNIIMLHLIWYIIVGLIAGWAAKSLMHMHMSLMWTVILGIVGSVVGGLVTHIFSRPKEGAQFHPAGIIVSILGALLVLWLWHHFKLHIPAG